MNEVSPSNKKSVFKRRVSLPTWSVVAGVVFVLLLLAMVWWQPWVTKLTANTRTVQVTGEATVKSEPDEFQFYPTYTSKNSNKQAALTELSKKSDEIVAKLKELGVPESGIKTNASSDNGVYLMTTSFPAPDQSGSMLAVTVTVNTREQAQKVQDYLLTTGATGSVSPMATFSTAKQKELQAQARTAAEKDARAKAEQTAKNLGFKLGAVKTVEDQNGIGMVRPMALDASGPTTVAGSGMAEAGTVGTSTISVAGNAPVTVSSGAVKAVGLSVMPGQDEVTYAVSVTYFVK